MPAGDPGQHGWLVGQVVLGAAVGALATAHAAVDTAIINQDTAEQAWDAAFEALCIKLESNTPGDKAKLTTTTIPT